MKAILEFDLPLEKDEHFLALNAMALQRALFKIKNLALSNLNINHDMDKLINEILIAIPQESYSNESKYRI